jgi:hypothetical protein
MVRDGRNPDFHFEKRRQDRLYPGKIQCRKILLNLGKNILYGKITFLDYFIKILGHIYFIVK